MFPRIQKFLCLLQQRPLLAGLSNIPVGFEEGANVDGLAAPKVSMNRPVQSKLQGAPVEREGSLPGRHGGRGGLRCDARGQIGIGSDVLCPWRDRVERSYCLARLRGRRNMQWLSGWVGGTAYVVGQGVNLNLSPSLN